MKFALWFYHWWPSSIAIETVIFLLNAMRWVDCLQCESIVSEVVCAAWSYPKQKQIHKRKTDFPFKIQT